MWPTHFHPNSKLHSSQVLPSCYYLGNLQCLWIRQLHTQWFLWVPTAGFSGTTSDFCLSLSPYQPMVGRAATPHGRFGSSVERKRWQQLPCPLNRSQSTAQRVLFTPMSLGLFLKKLFYVLPENSLTSSLQRETACCI